MNNVWLSDVFAATALLPVSANDEDLVGYKQMWMTMEFTMYPEEESVEPHLFVHSFPTQGRAHSLNIWMDDANVVQSLCDCGSTIEWQTSTSATVSHNEYWDAHDEC